MFRFLLRNLEITKNVLIRQLAENRVFSVGDLSQGPHLFPFRTEKLSLVEPMIVFMAKVGSRQHRVLDSLKNLLSNGFFVLTKDFNWVNI